MAKRNVAQTQTELRQRLQNKYPSMSETALRSAMMAAQNTMEGRTPRTTRTATPKAIEAVFGDKNAAMAKDGRKKRR